MEAEGLVVETKPPPKAVSKTAAAAAKKRKAASAEAGRGGAGAGMGQLPKLPPVRTVPKGVAKRQKVGGAMLPDFGGPAAGGPSHLPPMGHHSGAGGGLGFSLDPLLSPSDMQLFHDVNALLTGGDEDLLAGLVGSARGGTRLGSGSGSSTMALGDTPLSDMASVFSWFLNGTPTAAAGAAAAGPSEARVPTPKGAPAAATSAAAATQQPPPPSAQSVAALIRALSPAASPSATPRGAAGVGLMPAPGSRRAGGPSAATAAAAASAAAAGPSSGLTAEMGQRVLLQRLLHLRATGGGGGAGGSGVPMTPFTAAMTEHVFSPLAGHGARRSPRLPAVKTGGDIATPMAAPSTVGPAATTPAFTPGELQLLLATLGGSNPFAPGIAHDKVAEAQAEAAVEAGQRRR